jgi:hypothetical protein
MDMEKRSVFVTEKNAEYWYKHLSDAKCLIMPDGTYSQVRYLDDAVELNSKTGCYFVNVKWKKPKYHPLTELSYSLT